MTQMTLPETLRETLAVFDAAGEPKTTPEVATALDMGRRTAYHRLERLVEEGRLETKKVGANARVWWQASASETSRTELDSLVAAVEEYAIFTLDTDGCVQTWNRGAERIKGYTADEILGEHFSVFYNDSDRSAGVPEANLEAAARDGSCEDEGWRRRADGSTFWANVTITAVRDDDGEISGYVKVTRDMTDRRERELRLCREKELNERLLETVPVRLAIFGADGSLERVNSRAREQLEIGEGELGSFDMADLDITSPEGESITSADHPVTKVRETGEAVRDYLVKHTTADDEVRWVSLNAAPVTDERGTVERVVVAGNDVTKLKRKERQLERKHAQLAEELDDVFSRIDDAFMAVDDQWRITHANDTAATVVESSAGELVGERLWDAVPESAEGDIHEKLTRAMATQEQTAFTVRWDRVDRWLEVRGFPSESGMSLYARDITDRKQREEELELYETIVEAIGDGIYVLDEDGRFATVNAAYAEMTDYDREELLGAHCSQVSPELISEESGAQRGPVTEREGGPAVDPDVRRADGSGLRVETRRTKLSTEGSDLTEAGVVRDITERKERETELRKRIRQQDIVASLGKQALEDQDLDSLFAAATRDVADTLDNDYCKVLDLDMSAAELGLREGVGWEDGLVGEATVSAVEDDSQAAYTLKSAQPVVVEDLPNEDRFSGPDLLRDHDVNSGISTIIGPVTDPWGILGTHDTEPKSFSEHDVTFVQSVANILASAIERHEYEQQQARQGEQIAALNDLHQAVEGITSAVIEQSTRSEIEETVCGRLAERGSYQFAWVGEVDSMSQTVSLRTEAGVEGYLDDITISVDPDDEYSQGPTGRAFQTGSVQTTRNARADYQLESWRENAREYGFNSSAAIPIVHDGTTYGVLNVYSERPKAFEGNERVVISQLGKIVGHAIAAVERKQALLSDEVVELEFRVRDVFDAWDLDAEAPDPIRIEHTVMVDDGEFVLFGRTTAQQRRTIERMAEAIPFCQSGSFRPDGDELAFQLRVSEPPVLSAIASLGGSVETAEIRDGDYQLRVHLSPSVDTRLIVDALEENYPDVSLLKRRQVTKESGQHETSKRIIDPLTDKQQATLEAAYYAGFFEWPRDATGEDVAESLDISPPTFHQHLRKAERKIFERLIAGHRG